MKKQQIIAIALSIAIQANVPVLLMGAPGIGKSSTIVAIAKALGRFIEIVIASLREPSDFAGLPIIDNGDVKLAPPAWAKRLVSYIKGILLLDEITTAAPAVQAALLRVVLDRCVGDLQLPTDTVIIAAANPTEQSAGGWDLSAPLSNRFVHLEWQIDPEMWADGLVDGWQSSDITMLPTDWESELPVAKALVASFIRKLPHLLFQYPKEESQASKPWASPRSWTMATTLLAACRSANVSEDVLFTLMAGSIGQATAITFVNWLKDLDLPNPEMILANPSMLKIPTNQNDKLYTILSSVSNAVAKNNTIDRFYRGVKVMSFVANAGFVDIAYLHLRTLIKNMPQGANTNIPEMAVFAPVMQQAGLINKIKPVGQITQNNTV
ncbi:MAG: MoxR family ATPase [Blastocatellia bacterium]